MGLCQISVANFVEGGIIPFFKWKITELPAESLHTSPKLGLADTEAN